MTNAIGTIRIKGKNYTVKEFVGQVAEANKGRSIKVSGGEISSHGFGNVSGSPISSTTHVHDEFWLVKESGEERKFEFTDQGINVRVGHPVQVIWIIKEGKDWGCYVCVNNLKTRDVKWIDDGLKKEVCLHKNPIVFILTILVIILMAISMAVSIFNGQLGLPGWLLAFLAWLWWRDRSALREAKEKLKPFIKSI